MLLLISFILIKVNKKFNNFEKKGNFKSSKLNKFGYRIFLKNSNINNLKIKWDLNFN